MTHDQLFVRELDAERLLGLKPRTLAARRMRRQSMPPHTKMGRAVLYEREVLLAWLRAGGSAVAEAAKA